MERKLGKKKFLEYTGQEEVKISMARAMDIEPQTWVVQVRPAICNILDKLLTLQFSHKQTTNNFYSARHWSNKLDVNILCNRVRFFQNQQQYYQTTLENTRVMNIS